MNDKKFEAFKYLGATLCKNGTCSAEVRIRIASAMTAIARLSRTWRCNTISFANKFKLYKSLVGSILPYGCETWTLLADSEKKDPGFRIQVPEETSPAWRTRLTTACRARSIFLWVHRNLLWQLSRDGNLHVSGMSHASTDSSDPCLRAPWRVGNTVVG